MKKGDSITFISFALGLLIASFSFSLAPLISTWYRLPLFIITLLVAWGAIWQTTGSLLSGRISDAFGRRGSYRFDIICMLIGITIFVISRNIDMTLAGLAFILVGTGGEYSAISAATHEMFSSKFRGTAMLLELDFVNIGGTISALTLILLIGTSITLQRLVVSAFILAVLAFIAASRLRVGESGLWATARKSESELSGPSVRYRLFTAIAIGISEALGFNLIVYGLGPYYFPSLTLWIIFIGNLTEAVVGLTGSFVDRFSRKLFLMLGTGGSLFIFIGMLLTSGRWASNPELFWVPFIIYNGFIAVIFMTTYTFNGELWPTRKRGTYTAIVNSTVWASLIPAELILPYFPRSTYMIVIMVGWVVGFGSALIWNKRGIETAGRRGALEASGERLKVS